MRRRGTPARSKRDRVLALLRQLDWFTRPRILFTDHLDDLPLMRECDAVFWFGKRTACPEGIRLVPSLGLSADALNAELDRTALSLQGDHAT